MITSKLGTSNSLLGQVELGIHDTSESYYYSITVSAVSSIALGLEFFDTLTLTAATALSINVDYQETIVLTTASGIQVNVDYQETITLSAASGIQVNVNYQETVTLSATTALVSVLTLDINDSIILIASTATQFNINYEESISLSYTATISEGTEYFETITLANTTTTFSSSIDLEDTLTLSATTSLILNTDFYNSLTFSTTSGFDFGIDHDEILTISATANIVITATIEIPQTLIFTHSTSSIKIIKANIIQTLAFSDLANRSNIFNQALVQTFNLIHGRVISGQLVAAAVGELVSAKCRFRLQSSGRYLLLPCPLFGDSENALHEILIKRKVDGGRETYIRRAQNRRLNYAFSIDTQKRIELLRFVEDFSSELLTLVNHKGEKWRVYLTANPVIAESRERYEPRRERFDVTLEFEGLRLA
jgi:hypothetical protein